MYSWNNRGPVIVFICNWAPYRCLMTSSRSLQALPLPICPVRVKCAGRVDAAMILFALEKGAEGVMVIGCKDRSCRYGPGPERSDATAETIYDLMGILGLERERFTALKYAHDEGAQLFKDLDLFMTKLFGLEKSPFAR